MGGGLLQIIAYGSQDMYLTNDPQITFFKIVYRRHTNFAVQTFEKTFNDNPDFDKKGRVKLYKIGDLVTKMSLRIIINKVKTHQNKKFAWVKRLGFALLNSVSIEIGGIIIDKHYGTWLDIWYELTNSGKHKSGYAKIIGNIKELTEYNDKDKPEYTIYIPLQFWFNRHYGLALPLIAIQYHDVYILADFENKKKLIIRDDNFDNWDDVRINEVGLVTDYVYLDIDERRRFAGNSHEYLIEQVQYYGHTCIKTSEKIIYPNRFLLDFNFPTKEIIWALKLNKYNDGNKFLCYHHKDWKKEILRFSKQLLFDSIKLVDQIDNCYKYNIIPNSKFKYKNIKIINQSDKIVIFNSKSLLIKNKSLIDKISGIIKVNDCIKIYHVKTCIDIKDVSIPVKDMIDTRFCKNNVTIYQPDNYALYLDYKQTPLESAKLDYNADIRVEQRSSQFFGVLQPYEHHSNTPKDGINLYSFALEPEKLQPTGTSNLSQVENIVLTLWFNEEFCGENSKMYCYAFSYNVFRVIEGLTGIVYTN
jgi:hypothetical protein